MSPITEEFIRTGRAGIARCREILHGTDEFPAVTERERANDALRRTQAVR